MKLTVGKSYFTAGGLTYTIVAVTPTGGYIGQMLSDSNTLAAAKLRFSNYLKSLC